MQARDTHPIRTVVKLTSSKWMLPVLHVLSDGTKRYHEVHAALPDITQKVLTDMLHKLEGYGLVKRVAYPTVPPKVEYTLTELGESFTEALNPVVNWAKANYSELVETGHHLYNSTR